MDGPEHIPEVYYRAPTVLLRLTCLYYIYPTCKQLLWDFGWHHFWTKFIKEVGQMNTVSTDAAGFKATTDTHGLPSLLLLLYSLLAITSAALDASLLR